MKKDGSLLQRMAERFDLSEEPIPGVPIAEIMGDSRVLIEGHCGITQYDSCKICVKVRFGSLTVCGCNLELRQMTKDVLVISGRIESISLKRRNSR